MHLTNYAINKGSEKFEFNEGVGAAGKGSKRSIKWFREYLQANGHDDCEMWDEVADIVMKDLKSKFGKLQDTEQYKAYIEELKQDAVKADQVDENLVQGKMVEIEQLPPNKYGIAVSRS